MFAGRHGVVAVALLLLTCGAPLGAAEPIGRLDEAACPDEVVAPATSDDDADSHRRHVYLRSVRAVTIAPQPLPFAAADEVAVPTGDRSPKPWKDGLYVRDPVVERSTLAEVMRRGALWGDCCPLCGQSHAGHDVDEAEESAAKPATRLRRMFNENRVDGGDDAVQQKPGTALRAGEPAQVILDTQNRLGKSVLDGTEFGGSPETLIQWIRALDEENRRRQAVLEEASPLEAEVVAEQTPDGERRVVTQIKARTTKEAVTAQSQIESLRAACRNLQEAADLLEEQNLFESADSVREIAGVLREESRQKVGQVKNDDGPAPSADDDD